MGNDKNFTTEQLLKELNHVVPVIEDKNVGDIMLIVCHPDDEILFACATILHANKIKKTVDIVIVCYDLDSERIVEFMKHRSLFFNAHILQCQDDFTYDELKEKLITNVKLNELQHKEVITHGDYGEYNNNQHILVHKGVRDIIFPTNNYLYTFDPERRYNIHITIPLDEEIIREKQRLLQDYNSQNHLFSLRHTFSNCEYLNIEKGDEYPRG